MIWLSKSSGTSQAASFCPLRKWTYSVPSDATSGTENWSSSQSVPVPVVWKVQLGCEPEISFGADHVSPPSSDELNQIGLSAYEPWAPFRKRDVVRYGAAVERRLGVVVDGQPFLVVEDSLVRGADRGARALGTR